MATTKKPGDIIDVIPKMTNSTNHGPQGGSSTHSQTPSTGGQGGGGQSKTSSIFGHPGVRICLLLVAMFLVYSFMDALSDMSSDNNNNRDIKDATAALQIAEIKAKIPQIQAPVQVAPQAPVVQKSEYPCTQSASFQNHYFDRHAFPLDESMTVEGCTYLYVPQGKVLSQVDGNSFRIEVPVEGSNNLVKYCPSNENPDCAVFLNIFAGKGFRVLLKPEGTVTFILS